MANDKTVRQSYRDLPAGAKVLVWLSALIILGVLTSLGLIIAAVIKTLFLFVF